MGVKHRNFKMRTSRLILSTLLLAAGLATIASTASAVSILAAPAKAETAADACGAGTATADPLNLDLIPSKPLAGHQSVRGVGDDDDGCGEGTEHGGRFSDEGKGAGGNDD